MITTVFIYLKDKITTLNPNCWKFSIERSNELFKLFFNFVTKCDVFSGKTHKKQSDYRLCLYQIYLNLKFLVNYINLKIIFIKYSGFTKELNTKNLK